MDGEPDKRLRQSRSARLKAAHAEADSLRAAIEGISQDAVSVVAASRLDANTSRAEALKAFAEDLVAVADTMTRAVSKGPRRSADSTVDNLLVGLEMTEREFFKTAQQHGLIKISPNVGDIYDPRLHQPIIGEARAGGQILNLVAPGYSFQGEVLRAAAVIVEESNDEEAAALKWLQDLQVEARQIPTLTPVEVPTPAYVKVAGPFATRDFEPEAVARLLAKLRIASSAPATSERRERTVNSPQSRRVRPHLEKHRPKLALIAATLVVAAVAPTVFVSMINSSVRHPSSSIHSPQLSTPGVPLAYSLIPSPEPSPDLNAVSRPLADASASRKSNRSLNEQAALPPINATLPAAVADVHAPAQVAEHESTPSQVASIDQPRQTLAPDNSAATVVVLAERRQSASELDRLLSGGRSQVGRPQAERVSLDQDAKRHLSATLNIKSSP